MNHSHATRNPGSLCRRRAMWMAYVLAGMFCWLGLAEHGYAAEADGLLFGTILDSLADPAYRAPEGMADALKERVVRFRARAQAFRSRIPASAKQEFPERVFEEKRRRMEGGIVALIETAGIEALAADYAARAAIFYEWEGMSHGPLREAAFAEEFLRNNPQTALKPYLELFLSHRYKCAAEVLKWEKSSAYDQARRDYRRHLDVALKDADPLIRLVAASIRDRPFLYIRTDPPASLRGASAPRGRCGCAGIGFSPDPASPWGSGSRLAPASRAVAPS